MTPGTYSLELGQGMRHGELVEYYRIVVEEAVVDMATIVVVKVSDFCEWVERIACTTRLFFPPPNVISLELIHTYRANHWVVTPEGFTRWTDMPTDMKWEGTTGRLEVYQDTQGIPVYRD